MLAEQRPDTFMRWTYKAPLLAARTAISNLLNVPVDTCVFTQNATMGINVILRNLVFKPGDVIIYFDTIYGACEKTLAYIMETTPVEAAKVEYEYPIGDEELVGLFREKIKEQKGNGKRVVLAIFDTIVSLPGVRMPFERFTEVCREEGMMSCIDGAHGVGHIPLDLGNLDPDFFVSNCHKYVFSSFTINILFTCVRNIYAVFANFLAVSFLFRLSLRAIYVHCTFCFPLLHILPTFSHVPFTVLSTSFPRLLSA
jgi:hercynylcysteine S-oxide lyase